MSSPSPKTLVSMTTIMNQHRNTINREFAKAIKFTDAIEALWRAKRCWEEAAAAPEGAPSSRRLDNAISSKENLRATIEAKLKQIGKGWDDLEGLAKAGGKELPVRLTAEGSMNADMGAMNL